MIPRSLVAIHCAAAACADPVGANSRPDLRSIICVSCGAGASTPMFRRERCVMLLHLAAPAGEHGGEAEAAYNESEAETASLLVFVAK